MLLSVYFAAVQTVCFCWRLHEQESHKKMIVNVTVGLQAFPLLIYIFHAVSVIPFLSVSFKVATPSGIPLKEVQENHFGP